MARSFSSSFATQFTSFIQGELVLLFGFENEFKKLSSTLSTIQVVLEDASEKQLKDKAIENWLRKLNVAAYEVDDIMDQCKNEAARFDQCLLGCIRPNVIIFRYKVGQRIKGMMKKLDFFLAEPKVYGRDKEEDEMVKILMNNVHDVELLVLTILGMGGQGKTSLNLLKESLIGDMDLAPLQKKLQELLNEKRYFLVLDDVWNEDQEKWAKIKSVLNVGARGATVLATTHLEKVGSIMGTWQPYQLSTLSQEDCRLFFMQRAFGHQKETNPNLLAIGKEILKKCGGWRDESSILCALRVSYYHLPLDLRQCFAFCAVFPKDNKMEKKNLITLWMAHGFLLPKANLKLEDVSNEVWRELYLRSFFQEFEMHDLIHNLTTSLFSTNAKSSKIRQIKVAEKNIMSIGFAEVVPSNSPFLLKRFLSLRVLDMKYSKPPKKVCKLQNLQIRDLSCCMSLSYMPKQKSKLKSLRYLPFGGCLLTSLTPRTGSLTCLKKGYQLDELWNLNLHGSLSITHLKRAKNDTDAKEANLSKNANLYNLRLSWDISIDIECENCLCLPSFGELPCLENLNLHSRSSKVEYIEEDNSHSGFPTIRFPYLKRLAIERFPNLKGLLRNEGEKQFSRLEVVEIWHCPMFVFPTLSSVKRLDVWGKVDVISFSSIYKLTILTSLSIDHNFEATTLPEEIFKHLANLESLKLPSILVSLNALKCLKIRYCYALESLPEQGMESLTSLTDLYVQNCKMLNFYGCPTLTKRCEKGIGEDWHKIADIPNVEITWS
ncbi:unnamed protein product [Withania somnifera]